MEKEEFEERWKKIKEEQKVIVLKNIARFYADAYSFSIDLTPDGMERIEFTLYGSEIGNCLLEDVNYMV